MQGWLTEIALVEGDAVMKVDSHYMLPEMYVCNFYSAIAIYSS